MKKKSSPQPGGRRSAFLRQPFVLLVLTFAVALAIAGTNFNFNSSGRAIAASPQPTPPPKQTSDRGISQEALQQIAALNQEKESRTPAQKKIDSNVLYKIKQKRGEIAAGLPNLDTGLSMDSDGLLTVDITANVSDKVISKLHQIHANIIGIYPQYRSIRASVPLEQIESLAGIPDIIFIQPKQVAMVQHGQKVNSTDLPTRFLSTNLRDPLLGLRTGSGFEGRAQRVRTFLADTPILSSGSIQSEGDTTHQADIERGMIGSNGANIKIGVLSDGVSSMADSQASGDLPVNVIVLPGQVGDGDEGTAMLEIVHDVAPGAQLYFASAFNGLASFAQNINDLRAAGCDIIIDDVYYTNESPFHDGQIPSVISTTNAAIVTQAVNDVTASGALYFSSAGNLGNKNDGTSSVYQGDFVSGGTLALLPGGTIHDFGGGQQYDLIQAGSGHPIDLYWSDPLGNSSNDYDLYVLNSSGSAIVASSTNIQNGTQDPFEEIPSGSSTNNRIVVFKKTGSADRFFYLTITANGGGLLGTSTEGATKGHNIAANAFSVGATRATTPGPYPAAFSSSNFMEGFSADGPRRIFFNPDGSAITPGNFSSSGGFLRQKPDITAADGVSVTGAGGFPTTFFGTSAAAPHAGAIAALIKSVKPNLTAAQLRTALVSTAIDIEAPGVDRDSGAGIIMPVPALNSLGVFAGTPIIVDGGHTSGEAIGGSNGNGRIEPNEQGSLLISQLSNTGLAAAINVTATLSTSTPGVTVLSPATLPFSGINAGASSSVNTTPFIFQLANTFACGTKIEFKLTVNFIGGSSSPQIIPITVDTAGSVTISSAGINTDPPTDTHYTAVTGTQDDRIFRDGFGSACSGTKAYPGPISTGPSPRYNAYTFTAQNTGCATVAFSSPGGSSTATQLFAAAYIGTFDPANIAANYVGDSGLSPNNNTLSFAFSVTAGQQYTIVVSEVSAGGANNIAYTLTVNGPPLDACTVIQTAATVRVGGHVLTKDGKGIHKAVVTLRDMEGKTKTVKTNHFGAFSFKGLIAGQSYTLGAAAKGYTFETLFITPRGDQDDIDLVAR